MSTSPWHRANALGRRCSLRSSGGLPAHCPRSGGSAQEDGSEDEEEDGSEGGSDGEGDGDERSGRGGGAGGAPAAADLDPPSDSSEDERPPRNTVGEVPLEWYRHEEHIGYDVDGQKLGRRPKRDLLDKLVSSQDALAKVG